MPSSPSAGEFLRRKTDMVSPDCTVVGVEAMLVSGLGLEYQETIIKHLHGLLKIPQLSSAKLVVAIENNFGVEAETLKAVIQRQFLHRVVFMREKELKEGVCTTSNVKRTMMVLLRQALLAEQVSIANCLVTNHAKPVEMMEEFKGQMLRYREYKKPGITPFSAGKIAWSGKINASTRDDLCVTLQLAMYWRSVFYHDVKYTKFHH